MERLEAEAGPSRKLSDEEKQRIAEIDRRIDAKIAELKLSCDAKLSKAGYEEAETLQKELTVEIAALKQKCEDEKEKVWNGTED